MQNDLSRDLRSKLRRKNRLIAVLTILLIVVGVLLIVAIVPPYTSKFMRSAPYPTASDNVKKFRNRLSLTKKSLGVYYSADSIRYYLDSIYPRLCVAQNTAIREYLTHHPNAIDTTQYYWNVGFYWMMSKDDDDKSKHSFFVVPMLVNRTNPNNVFDYYDIDRSPFYERIKKVAVPRRGHTIKNGEQEEVDFSFNTGTMFP